MAASSVFLVNETAGSYCRNGSPPKFDIWDGFKETKSEARLTAESPAGNLIAIGEGSLVNVYDTSNGKLKCTIRQKMLTARFSPNGSFLIGFDNQNQNNDNFTIWSMKDGKLRHSMKLSKQPEVQFSADEEIYARISHNSIIFSTVPDFHNTAKKTPENMNVASFSISCGQGPMHILCFLPSTASGQPSFARLYQYPNFERMVASKSFFQADRTEMKWNKKGNAVLLITYTDVDKTGQSYYGKTMLHYLDTKGETATVQTDTDAPVIHAAEWSPNSMDFCMITGKMPNTRVVLLNSKCEKIFDMGVSARNAIHFNPQGTVVLLGGFGNLGHGKIDIWDLRKDKKLITTLHAPATTQLQWLNDGVHFITATTAPRLQIDNGFTIWDCTGKKCMEYSATKHLFGVFPFYSNPPPSFPDKLLDSLPKKQATKPAAAKIEEKKAAYVPPSRRGKDGQGAVQPVKPKNASNQGGDASNLTENEKKIRAVKKKLEQIDKLKQMTAEGKTLEKNQLEKISKEESLLEELKSLQI